MKTEETHLKDSDEIRRASRMALFLGVGTFVLSLILAVTTGLLLNSRLQSDLVPILVGAAIFIGGVIGGLFLGAREHKAEWANFQSAVQQCILDLTREGLFFSVQLHQMNFGNEFFITPHYNILCLNEIKKSGLLLNYKRGSGILKRSSFDFDELEEVQVDFRPESLQVGSAAFGRFATGGALVGGFAGAALGSVVDNLLVGSKETRFLLCFTLVFNGKETHKFRFVDEKIHLWSDTPEKIKESEAKATEMIRSMEEPVVKLRRAFGDKLKMP